MHEFMMFTRKRDGKRIKGVEPGGSQSVVESREKLSRNAGIRFLT